MISFRPSCIYSGAGPPVCPGAKLQNSQYPGGPDGPIGPLLPGTPCTPGAPRSPGLPWMPSPGGPAGPAMHRGNIKLLSNKASI